MERRYQVFVSSTFVDLEEERAAVVSALLQLNALPAGMELFPAADDDAWTLIEQVISESDYYLLVIGGKYGSVDANTELSYTEREFDFAVAAGKPVMAFLHANPDDIALGKSEASEAAQAKLGAFRAKVKARKHVKFWTGADSLQGKVAMSFASFTKMYPAIGWIRGDVETAAGALAELNSLRKQLDAAESRLEAARTSPPPGTDELSSGGEEYAVAAACTTDVREPDDEEGYPEYTTWTGREAFRVTWDELFSGLGPSLLDEIEQIALRRQLSSWLTRSRGGRFRAIVRKDAEKRGVEVVGFRKTKLDVLLDDFGTVIVQLKALGLIQRSDRKRSVTDKGTYWTLTPFGDTHLTTLRAIRTAGDGKSANEVSNADPDELEDE